MSIPDELLSVPLWKWQLNGLTLVVLIQLARGAWTFVKENGGFRGIWRTLRGVKEAQDVIAKRAVPEDAFVEPSFSSTDADEKLS